MRCQLRQRPEELAGILGVEHAPDEQQRLAVLARHRRERFGQHHARIGIVATIEPEFRSRRQEI